ncbi:MAG: hypothetical protein L3K15_05395 [Thermoplasmata archaeon]|nr:hypothetical protein [Thermoplasmata archaeon]
MTLPPGEIELSVEGEAGAPSGGAPRRVRLVARIPREAITGPSEEATLAEWAAALGRSLETAIERMAPGSGRGAPRADRSLEELVEAYHPRQAELIELLRDDGELTPTEHERLRQYLSIPTAASAPPPPRPVGRSLAEAPLERDRAPSTPRSVPELLALYQIESLKQAGAVRARRQISYEEYMAVKRHFATTDPSPAR